MASLSDHSEDEDRREHFPTDDLARRVSHLQRDDAHCVTPDITFCFTSDVNTVQHNIRCGVMNKHDWCASRKIVGSMSRDAVG